MIWVERGEEIFNLIEGLKISYYILPYSSSRSLANAATKYPKIDKKEKYLVNLEPRINLCRKNKMDVKSFELESKPLLSLSTSVSYLSGEAMNVNIDGEAKKYFLKARLYFRRIGQMNKNVNAIEQAGSF